MSRRVVVCHLHSCFSFTLNWRGGGTTNKLPGQRYPLMSVRVSSILPRYGDGWGSLGRKLSILTSSPPYYLLSSSSNVTSSNRYWLREYWRSTINCTSRNPTMVIQSHPVSPINWMYCQFIHINQLLHHIKPILPQR